MSNQPLPATLQISLAPTDHRLAVHMLPHQLRQWRGQFTDILVTLETRASRRVPAFEWENGRKIISDLVRNLTLEHPFLRLLDLDYSAPARRDLSRFFFHTGLIPDKDWRGGPYYTYFFGMARAHQDWIFHTDADIFFGGGSASWLRQAQDLMLRHDELIFVSPLPGPPGDPRLLPTQPEARPVAELPHAFRFTGMSTRLFLTYRPRWAALRPGLKPALPPLRGILRALLKRQPVQELPETILGRAMAACGAQRLDFLGSEQGMWSLHPPYRSELFYSLLPDLIAHVEKGTLPEAQNGHYDVIDAVVDWESARTAIRTRNRWKSLFQ